MSNLTRRVKRLEDEIGQSDEARLLIITNVAPWNGQETPDCVRIAPDRWAIAVRGGPFTDEEIRKLREEHKADMRSLEGKGNSLTRLEYRVKKLKEKAPP